MSAAAPGMIQTRPPVTGYHSAIRTATHFAWVRAASGNAEVTLVRQDRDMERSPQSKGVCVVTITQQPASLLITVTTRPNVENAAGQTVQTVTTIDEAVRALREFLILFTFANDAQ